MELEDEGPRRYKKNELNWIKNKFEELKCNKRKIFIMAGSHMHFLSRARDPSVHLLFKLQGTARTITTLLYIFFHHKKEASTQFKDNQHMKLKIQLPDWRLTKKTDFSLFNHCLQFLVIFFQIFLCILLNVRIIISCIRRR